MDILPIVTIVAGAIAGYAGARLTTRGSKEVATLTTSAQRDIALIQTLMTQIQFLNTQHQRALEDYHTLLSKNQEVQGQLNQLQVHVGDVDLQLRAATKNYNELVTSIQAENIELEATVKKLTGGTQA